MLEDLISERKEKLEILKKEGVDPYPARTARTMSIAVARRKIGILRWIRKTVILAGRITSLRDQGNLIFLDLQDESGKIQGVLKKSILVEFKLYKRVLDRGDFIEIAGILFKTKKGEVSIEARRVTMLSKSLRPLPTQWYGIENVETRLRKRYIDILMNSEVHEMFLKKTAFWRATREYLEKAGFLAVETPILEVTTGGAEAEPFASYHNALDQDVYLRIAPELWLKRLMVAGFEQVYEIGRIFRNEGMSPEHLQDFTTMEMYWAYQDYKGLMEFLEKMVKHVVKSTFGTLITECKGKKIDWGQKWIHYDYCKLFYEATKLDLLTATREELFKKAKELELKNIEENLGRGRLIDIIYKKTVRPTLIQPGFLINPPVDIEPLAKRMPSDPQRVERFQIVACGSELGKGFSELNDPLDQRKRFEEQMKLREAGDAEAQMLDEDYLEAMEYGMPPTAGFAYGDRLFAILVDKPIRETVLFPLVKPKE